MKKIGLFLLLAFLSLVALTPKASMAQVQYGLVGSAISSVNSSTATLTSGSVFTGTSEDVSKYATIRVNVIANVASATDGLSLQQSADGTNWDHIDVFTVAAATGKEFGVPVYAKFFRLVYTNGGTNQASLRLQTVFHGSLVKPSAVRPQDTRSNENDMEENLSYNMVYNGSSWDRARGDLTYDVMQASSGQSTAGINMMNGNASATSNDVASAGASGTNGFTFTTFSPFRSFSCQIIGSAGIASGQVFFEGSNDNTTYTPLIVYDDAVLTGTPIVAAFSIVASTNRYFIGKCTYRYVRCRISTVFAGGTISAVTRFYQTDVTRNVVTVAQPTAANLNATVSGTVTVSSISTSVTPGTATANLGKSEDLASGSADVGVFALGVRRDAPVVSTNANNDYSELVTNKWGALSVGNYEKNAKTYSCSFNVTVAALATDIAILPGNGTTGVYVTRITISAIATATAQTEVLLIKRSVANSGGTSSSGTAVPHDATDAAASSVPLIYTANPTPGAAVGTVRRVYVVAQAVAAVSNGVAVFDFGDKGKHLFLSGTAQGLAINLNGVTVTGGVFNITIEYIEI